MPLSMGSMIRLNNELPMPLLGLGVRLMRPGRETYEAMRAALDAGHRLVDTASFYGNEEDVGSAQILLRWAIHHGVVVIPRSRHSNRIRENARIFDFELPVEDIAVLDRLHDGFRSSWDPTVVP